MTHALTESTISRAPEAAPLGAFPPWKDVWSRTGRRYRFQAMVLLLINTALFAGVASFAFWIRSGISFAPAVPGYWDQLAMTFNFSASLGITLGSLLIEPISVQDVPMQIPILGLLLSALIAIPILVSILYRFWCAIPLLLMVAFLAVMPWLAITLTGSCLIASVRPFRTPLRFMSALLALVPAVMYLFLASAGTGDVVAGRIDPVESVKFVAPWILAIVASTLLFAIVLSIAKLVDYRSGAVTPLLAIMFALPAVLFEFHVGRDELHYRLVEGLDQAFFEDADASADLERAVQRAWERRPLPRPRREDVRMIEEEKWQMALAADLHPFEHELARHQCEIVSRVDRFLNEFPSGRYTANALFLKGRALDTRVDPGEFRGSKWVRFYDDFPSISSRMVWQILLENRPESVLSAVALLRLAQLELREGEVDRAMDRLNSLLRRFESANLERGGADSGSEVRGVMSRDIPEGSLHVPLARVVFQVRVLRDLVAANRDPVYDYDPLVGPRRVEDTVWFGLLDLDPRHPRYPMNVQTLLERYPGSQIEDKLEVELAKSASGLAERRDRLEQCCRRFDRQDAIPEAMFQLAVVYRELGDAVKSAATFRRLVTEFPSSPWAKQAEADARDLQEGRMTRAGE